MDVSIDSVRAKDESARRLPRSGGCEVPLGYKRAEIGVIPEDWQLHAVGRVGEVLAGKALAASAPGHQRPYLRTKNVFDGRIDIRDVLSMPMTETQFSQFELRRGDVLLNEGQSLELVGRCSIYQGEYPEPCAIQNQLVRFRARDGVSALYASHLFRYCQQTGVFARIALQTTSVAHLGASRFQRLVLAWPATEYEQCAVAEALSDVDGLLGALEALIAKKRAIKQAATQQLLTGKARLPGFSAEWETKSLLELADRRKDLFDDGDWIEAEFLTESGIRLIQTGNIGEARFIERAPKKYISSGSFKALGCKELQIGDILICRLADPAGRACILPDIREERVITAVDVTIFRPLPSLADRHYLVHVFNTPNWFEAVSERCGGSTRTRIARGELGKMEIKLPPLAEQTAIAAVLSDIDSDIVALERRREKTCSIKQGMMQQLLTGRVRLVKLAPAEAIA